MFKQQLVIFLVIQLSLALTIFSLSWRRQKKSFLMNVSLLLVLAVVFGCGSTAKQKRTKSFAGVTSCQDAAFEPRKGLCVRKEDQCPQYNLKTDNSCKQLPCSPGLYFDGFFCLSQKPGLNFAKSTDVDREDFKLALQEKSLRSDIALNEQKGLHLLTGEAAQKETLRMEQIAKTDLTEEFRFVLAGSFAESCVANLTNDQKIAYLAIFAISEKFVDPKVIVKKTWETRCLESYSFLSRMRSSRLHIGYAAITDVTPLEVFEFLPKIEKIVFAVSPSTNMTCPLTDQSRCIFVAWR